MKIAKRRYLSRAVRHFMSAPVLGRMFAAAFASKVRGLLANGIDQKGG